QHRPTHGRPGCCQAECSRASPSEEPKRSGGAGSYTIHEPVANIKECACSCPVSIYITGLEGDNRITGCGANDRSERAEISPAQELNKRSGWSRGGEIVQEYSFVRVIVVQQDTT